MNSSIETLIQQLHAELQKVVDDESLTDEARNDFVDATFRAIVCPWLNEGTGVMIASNGEIMPLSTLFHDTSFDLTVQ